MEASLAEPFTGLAPRHAGRPVPDYERPSLNPAEGARGIWHGRLHQRHWATFRPGRWYCPTAVPANAAALCAVLAFVVWALHRALVPQFAPGPRDIPQSVRDRAALLFALCWAPAIHFLVIEARKRRPLPFFAIYGCLYSLYYAISPMFGSANLLVLASGTGNADPAVDYAQPVDLLLAGWVLLILGYWFAPRLPAMGRTRIDSLLQRVSSRTLQNWSFGLLSAGVASEIMARRGWWPDSVAAVGNLFALLLESTLAVLAALWAMGKLSRGASIVASIGVVAALVLTLGGSATARLVFMLFALFIGVWLRRPVLRAHHVAAGAIAIATCVAMRGAMTDWRQDVWVLHGGKVSSSYRSALMIHLLKKRYAEAGALGTVADGWRVIAQRSSNVDLLIDTMRRTPADVPFWDGFTYQSLVGALVPRFVWPDKPTKTLGQDFGHRYRYISDADHTTSINLPVVIEFYINFGRPGLLIGMFVLGMLLKLIEEVINRPGQNLLISAAATPLLARLLVMECDLSQMYGGLPLQVLALWLTAGAILATAGLLVPRAPARPPWYAPLSLRLSARPHRIG